MQAHNEPRQKNLLMAWTLDCIYLRPNTSVYGGHELLHITTNKIILRFHITSTPATSTIIKEIYQITQTENMPKGLKINYLHDFIAGVHDQPAQNQDPDSKQNYNKYEEESTSATES